MRNDVHRPSVINPEDYEFVAFSYLKVEDLGSALFLKEEREKLSRHMAKTGGKYSGHEHGGTCGVCGSVNALYTACFYHKPSNSYVKTGLDCAEKLECYGAEAFRRKVVSAIEGKAGVRKARAVLDAMGLSDALNIKEAVEARRVAAANAYAAWREKNPEPEYVSSNGGYGISEVGAPPAAKVSRDEETMIDVVERLIKYGSLSDKAMNFLGVLIERIKKAPELEAARKAEDEAALPIPEFKGRAKIKGKVLTIRLPGEYDPYPAKKMLVKHDDGWKLWGTVPSSISGELERGDVVEFVATVKVSDKDPKFGFISRPASAKILKEAA